MEIDPRVINQVQEHPYPLMFATISGAHLYGFPSHDSDYDLRGIHLLPLPRILSLVIEDETVEKSGWHGGLEIDLVTHDAKKFFGMLLKRNGYVMEQVFSPLVVYSTPEFDELKSIAERCLTKHHAHHYLGFAASQWKLFSQEEPGRVKPLLYVFRVLLTGINLMQTGVIESNLLHLNDSFRLPFLPDLIDRKLNGDEQGSLQTSELAFFEEQYATLVGRLEQAYTDSKLREMPEAGDELNELLVRLRLWGSDS